MVYSPRRRMRCLLRVNGDRTHAIRRSSVACQGYQSASVLGRTPLVVLSYSVLPSVGYVPGQVARKPVVRSQEARADRKEGSKFWPPIRHSGVASADVTSFSRPASKSFTRAV